MTGQAMVTVLITALVAVAIIMAAISAAAVITLLTASTFALTGVVEKVAPETELLAALVLAPGQAMIMAAMQLGSLATIMELMQDVNLVMISATL
ncbi:MULTISPECIES: hypothetical protein [unclassified Pseudomonas]|uniref:Sodium:proton antiporter n=1 Tax=Pseudomonas sp. MYb327 TaxID=2745230 RepID=A0AAU8EA56_9PSED